MPDFSSLILMLMLICTGFVLSRVKLLRREQTSALPGLLLNMAYPALIIKSVTSVDVGRLAKESLIVAGVTAAVTLALFVLGTVLLKRYKDAKRRPLILFSMAVGNIAYVALPVVRMLYGDVGVYYTILHSTTQDVMIWTLYYAYFVGGGTLKGFKPKKILSPGFAAIVLGVLLAAFGIKPLGTVAMFLEALAALTVPLALVYIGAVLASYKKSSDWMPDRDTCLISVIKVLVLPAAVYGIMWLVPADAELRLMMALFFAAPVTVLSTIWAKEYGFDYHFSVKALIFSTLLFLLAAGATIIWMDR